MSRKYDRSRRINDAALHIIKASVKPKPRWVALAEKEQEESSPTPKSSGSFGAIRS